MKTYKINLSKLDNSDLSGFWSMVSDGDTMTRDEVLDAIDVYVNEFCFTRERAADKLADVIGYENVLEVLGNA